MVRLLMIACALAAAPGPAPSGAPAGTTTPDSLEVPAPPAPAEGATPIDVSVDPRIELLAVVQVLAGDDQLGHLDLTYRREVLTRFAPWRAHAAVTLYARMQREGFARDLPPALVLRLSPPPELELRAPFTATLEARAGGRDRLFAFLDSLRDFAAGSRFMEFYAAHAAMYERLTEGTRHSVAGIHPIAPLEEYFGTRLHSYHLILAPLAHAGGFGAGLERPPEIVDAYAILGPSGAWRGRPRFWDADALEALLWHEFSHVFVGDLPETCRRAIEADSALFEPLRPAMRQQGYMTWETCADEHLVRAVGVRLVGKMEGVRHGDEAFEQQYRLGFAWLPRLLLALQRYETSRDRYPTLADFCPELTRIFDQLAMERTRRP